MAASRGHNEVVGVLISSKADVNSKNNIGNTALMLSVRSLLDAGADTDIRNNKREQAISLAEPGEDKTIIKLIRKHEKEKKLFGIF